MNLKIFNLFAIASIPSIKYKPYEDNNTEVVGFELCCSMGYLCWTSINFYLFIELNFLDKNYLILCDISNFY